LRLRPTDAPGADALSIAKFSDTLSVSAAPSFGFIQLVLRTHGTLACTIGDVVPCASSVEVVNQNGNSFYLLNGTSTFEDTYSYTGTSDVPLSVLMEGQASCLTEYYAGYAFSPSCTAAATFEDTLPVEAIDVLNLNGQIVSGAEVSSASGTNYKESTSTMPEPGSLSMLVLSVVSLLAGSRKRVVV
jgi:hypothetical protein